MDATGGSRGIDPDIEELLDGRAGLTMDSVDEQGALERVRRRVMEGVAAARFVSMVTVPVTNGSWESMGPGVERKILWREGGMQSCLMRIAAGASVAGHDHPSHEECIVLEGAIQIGNDILLRKGDYHMAPSGSVHGTTTSECGALVFLRCVATE